MDSALRMTNFYRMAADMPDLTLSTTYSSNAQLCAVMMKANKTISHSPPSSWTCYTAAGAQSAGQSNLAAGMQLTAAVMAFMEDYGASNATALGHRRWILGNWIGPTGFGYADAYTCMHVVGSNRGARPWVAWPPAGEVPVDEVFDRTGWSFQSDVFEPTGVEVSSGGVKRSVSMTKLSGGYGSTYAISFVPQGWTTQAGQVYQVTVTGASSSASYRVSYPVKPVSCTPTVTP